MWVGEKGCDEIINEMWDQRSGVCEMKDIMNLIGRCSSHLNQWNRNFFGYVDKSLNEAKAHLQRVQSRDPAGTSMETLNSAKQEVYKWLEKEELMWK